MKTKRNDRGIRKEIIESILMCGSLPYGCIKLFPHHSPAMYQRVIKDMIKESLLFEKRVKQKQQGVVRSISINHTGENTINLNDFNKRLVAHYESVSGSSGELMRRSDTQKSDRARRVAEGILFAKWSGVKTYANEKLSLTSDEYMDESYTAYYSIGELRGFVPKGTLISKLEASKRYSHTRSIGFVVANGTNYACYNAGQGKIRLGMFGEISLRNQISSLICKKKKSTIDTQGIIFYRNENAMTSHFLTSEPLYAQSLYIYEKTYGLVLNDNYMKLFKLMCVKNFKERLLALMFSEEDVLAQKTTIVECDVVIGNRYILFFGSCDLRKLKSFTTSYYNNEDTDRIFEVYCFEFQLSFLKQVLNNGIKTQIISNNAFNLAD